MPRPRKHTVTRRQADRHEALYLRLVALVRQAEAVAARRPGDAVPEALRGLAESALYDSLGFRRHARRAGLVPAAPLYGALSAQLGEALASLVGFEARHTSWDDGLNAQMWRLDTGAIPVRRHQPRLAASLAGTPATDPAYLAYQARMADLRDQLALRIDQFKRRQPPQP
jgi:hypothetical protein